MAHEIVQRIIGSETDQRVVVDNLHPPLVRKMVVGSDWNKIRIGIRLSVRSSAQALWYFGLCSGTSTPLSATPQHFYGVRNNGGSWHHGNGITIADNHDSGRLLITDGTHSYASASSPYLRVQQVENGATDMYLEITKGDPSWPITFIYRQGTVNAPNISVATFKERMSAVTVPLDSYAPSASNIDESTYGVLDSVCFAFSSAVNAFEVSDFAYAVLA